jgi:microcystin-dependent protein
MSDTTTPYLGLTKPAVGGSNDTWGNKDNADADLLDANASTQDSRLTALEARCTALENRPAVQEAVGSVKWWPTNLNFPPGFLICDGTWYVPSSYPDLFAVLSDAWGGDGVNSFAVPDLRGMVCIGMDEGSGRLGGQYGADRLGGTGGVAYTSLTLAQIPPHQHSGTTEGNGQHVHNFVALQLGGGGLGGGPVNGYHPESDQTDSQGLHQHTFWTDWQGSGGPHTNCQPGALGYWIIKAVKQ